MKKKTIMTLIVLLLCFVCLVGCGTTTLSETDIINSLPDEIKTIYVDETPYTLDVTSMEVEKRKIEEDIDEIHCTITTQNDHYRHTISTVLTYVYYDEGGWILEYYDTIDSSIEAIDGPSQEDVDAELSRYYFDHFDFLEQSYNTDAQTASSIYSVNFTSSNFSYDGNVTLESYFCPDWYGGDWEHVLSYDRDFVWNVDGHWAGDPDDINGSRWNQTALELEIYSVNQSGGIIDFCATEYRSTSDKDYFVRETGNTRTAIVMDYTGTDYLTALSYKISPDEETLEKLKYQAPTLSFTFDVGDSNYAARITPHSIYVDAVGYGGNVTGYVYRGLYIGIDFNDFGWPQFQTSTVG